MIAHKPPSASPSPHPQRVQGKSSRRGTTQAIQQQTGRRRTRERLAANTPENRTSMNNWSSVAFARTFVGNGLEIIEKPGARNLLFTPIGSAYLDASEAIGGGKFMNGAITGAYTFLFNHAWHPPQTQPTTRVLSKEQAENISSKISEVALSERWRRIHNAEGKHEDIGTINVNVDLGIPKDKSPWTSNIYTAKDVTIKVGNKTVSVDLLYSQQANMNVRYVNDPSYDATPYGRYWLQSETHKSGFLIELTFQSKADYNRFKNFINGH